MVHCVHNWTVQLMFPLTPRHHITLMWLRRLRVSCHTSTAGLHIEHSYWVGLWLQCYNINVLHLHALIRRGRLYSSCVRSSMLQRSETWPVRKENEVALQRTEMRMVRWRCNVKVKDSVPSKELRERLGIDDIILILQQNRLQWYGHVLRKEDNDWVKKCMEYEVEGSNFIFYNMDSICIQEKVIKMLHNTSQEIGWEERLQNDLWRISVYSVYLALVVGIVFL